jgi:hypothetical protein
LPGGSSLSETLAARRRTTTIEVKPKAISARRKSSSHRSRKPAQRASQRTSNFSWAEFDRKQAAR